MSNTILLLNPPAGDIIIRDNYCSKVSQASYINHPIDLVVQSGFLTRHFRVVLIDCIVQKLTADQCISEIQRCDPGGIFALTGNASWNQDLTFFKRLNTLLPHVPLVVSGDIFLEKPDAHLKKSPVFSAILSDYTSPALSDFFLNRTDQLPGMVFRDEHGIQDHRSHLRGMKEFRIPVPAHPLFLNLDYRYPFVRRTPFCTVVTEYGCPFHCSFCVMGTLGHKVRPIDNVLDELIRIRGLDVRDIFFVDQSFGSVPDRNIQLCRAIQREIHDLEWVCFSRVDLVNEDILHTMKSAGCHTIIFGVETANPAMLEKYRKGYTLEQVRSIFALARRMKIRTVATFLLGLPGESAESAADTIEFAKKLDCDFASLNVAVPRMGTELRSWAIQGGHIDPDRQQFDQSGTEVIMDTEFLSSAQLARIKQQAVKQIYLRPGYLLRRLLSVRSLSELRIQLRDGYYLVKRFIKPAND